MTEFNRGKPLRPEQKAAIVEGLKGAIAQAEKNVAAWKKQLDEVEKLEVKSG